MIFARLGNSVISMEAEKIIKFHLKKQTWTLKNYKHAGNLNVAAGGAGESFLLVRKRSEFFVDPDRCLATPARPVMRHS